MSAARPETGATREDGDLATGATDEQVNQALDYWCTFNDFRPENRAFYERDADQWAASFVPPGSVIALADHVTDAADREAIGRVWMAEQARLAMAQAQIAAAELDDDPYSDDYREARQDAIKAENAWRANCQAITPEYLARLERLRGSGGEETT